MRQGAWFKIKNILLWNKRTRFLKLTRHTKIIGLCLIAVLLSISSSPTFAQQTPQLTHTYTFGQSIAINLSLPPGNWESEALLFLRIGEEDTEPYPLTIENAQANYQRDLRTEPFPPFAKITYWVEYQDSKGNPYETAQESFLYEDNRFDWQTLHEDNITVKWVDGSTEVMIEALDLARTSLESITDFLQSPPLETVEIYIYPSLPDLQMALRLTRQEWVGGQARPDVGVVLLAIPNSEETIIQMQQYIPHELTHLILYKKMGPQGYAYLPTWLNEGLASHFEQRPEAAYAVALEKARNEGDLIPLSTLSSPFYSMPTEKIILAYAESQSVTAYLQQTYGWSAIRALLDAYTDGLDYSQGVEKALNTTLAKLERDWQVWLEQGTTSEQQTPSPNWTASRIAIREMAPWLFLSLLTILPGLLMSTNLKKLSA